MIVLRFVTMKRKNPIDFGGSRSKGGARGGGVRTPVLVWFPRYSARTGMGMVLSLTIRLDIIKRKNPMDFGGSRSKGGGLGGPNPRFGLVSAR